METEQLPLQQIIIGTLLAAFFATGFITSQTLQPQEQNIQKPETPTDKVDRETAIENGKNYLQNGPLSYPFTYNLSTENIQTVQIGNTQMYNWTITYTVEANPFNGPTYEVPGNQTKTRKNMNLYMTTNGEYIFPSQPIKITR
ncbi:MAG: hypothetical protein ABEJ95_00830 [Candidatus Nanohalobium sp.]